MLRSSNTGTVRAGFLRRWWRWWSVVKVVEWGGGVRSEEEEWGGGVRRRRSEEEEWRGGVRRRSEEEWGGVRRSEEEWGGVRRSEEEWGGVRRSNYMQWRHAGKFKQGRTKLADYAFFSVPPRVRHNRGIKIGLLWIVRVLHMAKLLSKLVYSRVIAVSLLGKDKFPQVYWRIFRMFHSEESICHKN
jgi:hypothetical protein